ncbi:hypothetical protein AGMMS49525_14970 [Bacteroidia bacterium]|nr:hypothetical protein AGMMS49525_14970 [Bacteroidia bacterium]
MKKILFLLVIAFSISSCEKEEIEPTQDYTSFTIRLDVETDIVKNTKTGYFNETGDCILLGEHGNLIPFVETAEYIMPEFHDSIYIFNDWSGGTRLEAAFTPKKNKKTVFILNEKNGRAMAADKNDPKQYPR